MKLMVETTNLNHLSIQFSTGGTQYQFYSNQFSTESSVGNPESVQPEQQIVQSLSVNLAQQIIFVNYLSRQLDAAGEKKNSLGPRRGLTGGVEHFQRVTMR